MYEPRSVTEIARHFADYINRVVYRGERFVLMRGNKPVAELGPVPAGKRLAELPALLGSLPKLSEAEADAFADDLAEARSMLSATDVRDPWAS
jgi:antitoxin (DNA-binding transcriptional repressor) of toxin-antitoxin stability system